MTGTLSGGRGGARGDRPAPLVLPGGDVVVPAAVVEALGAALDRLEAYERGAPPPRRQGGLTRGAFAVRRVAWEAALEFRARQETQAACAAATLAVLTPAQPRSLSCPEELTTEQAAVLLRVTEARVRQLAAAGAIEGRKTSRNVWLLTPESVRAYSHRRGAHHDDDTHRSGSAGAA